MRLEDIPSDCRRRGLDVYFVVLPSTVSRVSVADFMDWKTVLSVFWTTISTSGTIFIISNIT